MSKDKWNYLESQKAYVLEVEAAPGCFLFIICESLHDFEPYIKHFMEQNSRKRHIKARCTVVHKNNKGFEINAVVGKRRIWKLIQKTSNFFVILDQEKVWPHTLCASFNIILAINRLVNII